MVVNPAGLQAFTCGSSKTRKKLSARGYKARRRVYQYPELQTIPRETNHLLKLFDCPAFPAAKKA
jgi:hypothetical protein